ncbi:hypothetical protein [Falsibacillus albus]|uniref:Flagellar hook-length control protein FliK n=1 Tax=Falsibacillus albus TaxID=2478915 RepID=A0A3L7K1C9_9BACI|nr:hypothetical protein [Falsibacillus albus]RLQ95761.1 hypothetical protein D9X91_09045 [Falsibacillus albus]
MVSPASNSVNRSNADNVPKNQIRSFKSGEIIHGTIKKMFSNGTAEVQVGSQKLIAKLETGVKLTDSNWFQVSFQKGELRLTPIPNVQISDSGMAEVFKNLNLPADNATKKLVQFLMQEKLPLTKEVIVNASLWLKDAPTISKGLKALKVMFERGMPLSKSIFLALTSMAEENGISGLMDNLHEKLLLSSNKSSTTASLLSVINELKSDESLAYSKALTMLVKDAVGHDSHSTGHIDILKSIGVADPSIETSKGFYRSLIEKFLASEIPDQEKDLSEFQHVLKNDASLEKYIPELKRLINQLGANIKAASPSSETDDILAKTSELMDEMSMGTKPTLEKVYRHFVSGYAVLASGKESLIGEEQLSLLLGTSLSEAASEMKLLRESGKQPEGSLNLVEEALTAVKSDSHQLDKGGVLLLLKHVLDRLGIDYESGLLKESAQPDQLQNKLKPLLVQFLQEGHSQELKDAAQRVLSHLNGQHILSVENGPLQNIIMQFPFQLLSTSTDVTLQWTAKKRENGEIDPDYCKILFYLNLRTLNETIIDMNVQNRVVSLTLHNEKELNEAAAPFLPILSSGLEAIGYKLSFVQCRPLEKTEKRLGQDWMLDSSSSYSGVDMKV